jgi:hypothetical protein
MLLVGPSQGVFRLARCTSLLGLLLMLFVLVSSQTPQRNDTTGNKDDLDDISAEQKICVQTPKEFAEAFAKREPRCVSTNLIGRVFNGVNASTVYLQVDSKPATFYSGHDALERYLLSGYPEDFGYFTPSRAVNSLSDPDWPGLSQGPSNGFGLLQTIGYSPEYIHIDRVYVLSVFDVRDIATLQSQNKAYPFNADVAPLQPTWDALKEYYEWVYDDLGLVIPEEAMDVLRNSSFTDLTGCPVRCSYTSKSFPSENSTSPVITRDREEYAECPPAEEGTIQITPSPPDEQSAFCDPGWKAKMAEISAAFTAKYCQPEESVEAAKLLRDALRNATDVTDQAQWFRAFLIQSCVGTFSSLFVGNGFTYTGNRGLLTPTATEYIASPFNVSELPPEAKVDIFFCINGLNNGSVDADGTCPIPQLTAQAADVPGGLVARDSALPLYSLLPFLLHCLLVHIVV